MPLILALSLLSGEEEEELVTRTNTRLKHFEDFKSLEIKGSIFDGNGEGGKENQVKGKESCQEKDLAEIQRMMLDDDSGDEAEDLMKDGELAEDIVSLEGEAVFSHPEVEGMEEEEDDDIEILEILPVKRLEKVVPEIKKEVKIEQVEETGGAEL